MKKIILVIKMLYILVTTLVIMFVIGGCEDLYQTGLLIPCIIGLIILLIEGRIWISDKDIQDMINLFESEDKMLNIFDLFLKNHQCYNAFYDSCNFDVFKHHMHAKEYKHLITSAFVWEKTSEGLDYWSKINRAWISYLKVNELCDNYDLVEGIDY